MLHFWRKRSGTLLIPVLLFVQVFVIYGLISGCDLTEEASVSEIGNPMEPVFETRLTYATGASPNQILVGDVNQDGTNDIVTLNWADQTASVLLAGIKGYAEPVAYPVGATPREGILTDLDGNGTLDIAAVNESTDWVTMLLGAGDGTFVASQGIALQEGALPGALVAQDLDGDGVLDLVAANTGTDSLTVSKGNGEGGYYEPQYVPIGFQPAGIWAGQLKGDPIAELVVVNAAANSLSIFAFREGTYVQENQYPCGNRPRYVAAVDINRDQHLDLIVNSLDAAELSILFGMGEGQFHEETRLTFPGPVSRFVVKDFTRDNLPDIAVLLFDKIGEDRKSASTFCTVRGDGVGGFEDLAVYGAGWGAISIRVEDMNGDNSPDICTSDLSRNTVSLAYNRGDGTFKSDLRFDLGDKPGAAVIADFNDDSVADVAVVNRDENSISIMAGNGDGTFYKLNQVVLTALPLAMASGDLNGDGKQDLAVTLEGQYVLRIFWGVGNGIFLPPGVFKLFAENQGPLPEVRSIALGDVNNDAMPDVVTGNTKRDSVSVLLCKGAGQFQDPVVTEVDNYPLDVHLEDMNSDGKQDLIFLSTNDPDESTDGAEPRVVRWFGNGDGTFDSDSHVRVSTGANPRTLQVGDITGDGRPDVVTEHAGGNNVFLLKSVSNTNFAPGTKLFIGEKPVALQLADIRKDGKNDLVCALSVGSIVVRFSRGELAFEAPNNFIVQPGLSNVLVAHVNQDKYPDLIAINATNDFMAILRGGPF